MAAPKYPASLQDFALEVAASVQVITEYCRTHDYAQPSLRHNAAERQLDVLPKAAPEHVHLARQQLINAATSIQQIATEPSQYLPQLAVQPQQITCLQWLCRYNIPALVPADGSISYVELATTAKVPIQTLKSVVRMAVCNGFLTEEQPGAVGHSRLSTHFANNTALQDWAVFLAEGTVPMALRLYDATEKWGETANKTETAFNVAWQTDLPFFNFLETQPSLVKGFSGYMKNVTAAQGTAIHHLLSGFDWKSLGEAKIVDVGGSSGHASIALANAHPSLSFVVQDLPSVIETSKANLPNLEDSVAQRISFQGHDFFQEQPVTDADIYLLRMILHDWPPAEAKTIVQNIYRALKPGARIIVMDTSLPVPGSVGVSQEAQLRVRDLVMMETFNAHEREMEQWEDLFSGVDQHLKIVNAVQPFGSNMTVMEIASEGASSVESVAKGSVEVVVEELPAEVAVGV